MKKVRDEMVIEVATAAHEDWRAQWRAANGDKPRIKKTKDTAWIAVHYNIHSDTAEVDIAALSFVDLPSDWQAENRAAAKCAVDCVLAALEQGRPLDDSFVEESSATQHKMWLERNGSWASESQKLPYAGLVEGEKEKDRFFVRQAIAAYES